MRLSVRNNLRGAFLTENIGLIGCQNGNAIENVSHTCELTWNASAVGAMTADCNENDNNG